MRVVLDWWLGLLRGKVTRITSLLQSAGPNVDEDKTTFDTQHYYLDGPPPIGGNELLLDVLKEKARKGVDVRVLGWVSSAVMDSKFAQLYGAGHIADTNAITMNSIEALRDVADPALRPKAVLNVLGHAAGAVHMKMIIIGTANNTIGLTGGLDLVMDRHAVPRHPFNLTWHDAMAYVRGPIVQAMVNSFRHLWNEILANEPESFNFEGDELSTYLEGTPSFPDNVPPVPIRPTGRKHHVQTLQTIPAARYGWNNCLPETNPVSFAPEGRFEIRTAWRKAILAAQKYIYLEDQAFWSQEVLSWINQSIRTHSDLRVILVTGASKDPNDPEFADQAIRHQSINLGLLNGLTSSQVARVKFFVSWGDTQPIPGVPFMLTRVDDVDAVTSRCLTNLQWTDPVPLAANALAGLSNYFLRVQDEDYEIVGSEPVPETGGLLVVNVRKKTGNGPPAGQPTSFSTTRGIFIHTKTTLIDDEWALIGSNNCMRRSLYTDWEHAVSFFDGDGDTVKEYRKRLWSEHFRLPAHQLDDLDQALQLWEEWDQPFPTVSPRPPGRLGPPYLQPFPLPVPEVPFSENLRILFDTYHDPDSREPWGGLCPPGLVYVELPDDVDIP